MATVTVHQVIDASPERVWAVLTDVSGRAAWLSTVDSVEPVTAEPLRAGSVWRETRVLPDGDLVTEEFRVRESDPPHRLVVTSPGLGADYRMTYTLVPVEAGRHRGGTEVTATQEGTPLDARARLLALVFGGLAARTVEGALRDDLADLAAAIRPGDPSPDREGSAAA